MADTWYEYLQGSPAQRLADLEYQRKQYDAAMQSPMARALRRLSVNGDTAYDPRAMLAELPTPDGGTVADTLYPRRSSDAAQHEGAAINYATQMGMRFRDTALRGAQELAAGSPLKAAELAARAPLAAFYPPAASGTPDSPDDWRPRAKASGVSSGHILAFDWLTDPEMWVTAPVSGPAAFVVPALPFAAAKVAGRATSRADDALRAIGRNVDQLRYGSGARTDLVDPDGEIIRRLRNSPQPQRLGIEYAR